MTSFKMHLDPREKAFSHLLSQISVQLRDAYARERANGNITQASLAQKLDVGRSCVHRWLGGDINMTVKTIADLVWALDHDIDVCVFKRDGRVTNRPTASEATPVTEAPTSQTVYLVQGGIKQSVADGSSANISTTQFLPVAAE